MSHLELMLVRKQTDVPAIPAGSERASLDEPLAVTLARWETEAGELAHAGVYDWLVSRVPGSRVLEIGCGFGYSSLAIARGGKQLFALDNRMDCLEATQKKIPEALYGLADVQHYDERLLGDLNDFAPDAVVCWLAGAPADALPRDVPPAYAVMQHRLALQQAVVRLAYRLPSVQSVHLADRSAFPWKMKEAGRQTLAKMITTAVILDMPFVVSEANVQFRKIDDGAMLLNAASGPLRGIVPVVGEATLKRVHNAH